MTSPFRPSILRKKSPDPDDNFDLVGLMNELQNKMNASGQYLDIPLPQIVVVGGQSAGKTSLLEGIVGKEFLPRGTGVVTRRPTIIQLYPDKDEYAVFMHKDKEVFRNFNDVMKEIEQETQREPGPVGFSSKPIILKVFSPNVLKLTLVDLPGLIRVTVGDQSEDSIEAVRNMVLEEIKKPHSLILAVTPANQDLATSDALEIAKTVDPKRVRTIGVLTKLDLMQDGTDARDILENKVFPLNKGYVGVCNRSPKDIEEGRDIKYCLQKEKEYFTSKACYRDIAHKMGIHYLQKLLHQELRKHIKEFLPVVRKEISQKLSSLRKEIGEFENLMGNGMSSTTAVHFYMHRLVQEFIEEFCIQITGYSEKVNTNTISAGARIKYKLLNDIQKMKMPDILEDRGLLVTIINMHGIRNCFSMPSLAVESVNSHLVAQYIEPLNELVYSTAEILHACINKGSETLESYPVLRDVLLTLLSQSIDDAAFKTKELLESHIRAEMNFVNLNREDFEFPEFKMADIIHPIKLNKSENEDENTESLGIEAAEALYENSDENSNQIVDALAENPYAQKLVALLSEVAKRNLKIVQTHIADFAMKYISFHLVGKIIEFVKLSLMPSVWASDSKDSIFEEFQNDFAKMEEVKEICTILEEALHLIQNF